MPKNILYTSISQLINSNNICIYFPVIYLKNYLSNPNYILDFVDQEGNSIIVTVKKNLIENIEKLPVLVKAVITKYDDNKKRFYFDVSREDCLIYEPDSKTIISFFQQFNYIIAKVKSLDIKFKQRKVKDFPKYKLLLRDIVFCKVDLNWFNYVFVYNIVNPKVDIPKFVQHRKVAIIGEIVLQETPKLRKVKIGFALPDELVDIIITLEGE